MDPLSVKSITRAGAVRHTAEHEKPNRIERVALRIGCHAGPVTQVMADSARNFVDVLVGGRRDARFRGAMTYAGEPTARAPKKEDLCIAVT